MSSYLQLGATGQEYIQEEEYKALFGYPNGKVNAPLSNEVPGTSRPFILQNQLYAQTIPTTAPTDLGPTADVVVGGVTYGGTKQTSSSSPYLVRYNNITLSNADLAQATDGGALTYWFIGANLANAGSRANQVTYNILNQGVPNNLDPAGGYIPFLYINGTLYTFGNTQYPWTYNVNSGIVLFTGSAKYPGSGAPLDNLPNPQTQTVTMSFWRYEGTIGSPGVWSSNGNNIYNTNSGYVGIGTTGPQHTLDVNGNINISSGSNYLIDGNPVFGATGATGATGAQGAPGMETTVPIVTFGAITSEAANIYIPISYPEQSYYGSLSAPLPVIAGCIFNITQPSITSILDTTTGAAFNPYYVKGLAFNSAYPGSGLPGASGSSGATGLQGLILSNTTGSTAIPQQVVFPGESVPRKAIYYNTSLLTLGTTGTIQGSYYDYATISDPTDASFPWYTQGTAPSADAYYYTYSNTAYNTVTFTVFGPSQTNTANGSGVSVYCNAEYITTGSTIRYPNAAVPTTTVFTPVNFSPNTWVYPNTPTTSDAQTVNTLYPNSGYTLNLTSTNSLGESCDPTWSRSPDPYLQPTFTTPFAPITFIPTTTNISGLSSVISTTAISVPNRNIYLVSDNTQIAYNLYNNPTSGIASVDLTNYGLMYGGSSGNYTSPTTTNFYIGNQATSSTVLMTLNANIDSILAYTSSLTYKGFPNTTPSLDGANFTASLGTITDQYNGETGSDGFYLYQSGASFTFNSTLLTASSTLHTFNLQQLYYSPSPASSPAGTYDNAQNFYYDDLSATSVSSCTIDNPTATTSYVSGVSIMGTGTVSFDIATAVTNLADYFYVSNPLTYAFSGGLSAGSAVESNLANATQTLSTSNWTFSRTTTSPSTQVSASVNTTASPVFTTTSTVSVQAFSVSTTGGSSSVSASYNLVIYDVPSYTLIQAMPPSIPTILSVGTASNGYRVWSAPDQSVGVVSNNTYVVCPPNFGASSSTVSYSSIGYQQSWALNNTNAATVSGVTIDTTQELQIYNGLYQSATASSSSGILGYTDYTNYFATNPATNPNYSTTNFGAQYYRYATFCWKIGSTLNSTTTKLNFTINNCNCNVATNSPNTSTYGFTNGTTTTQRFLMFYRIEQLGSITPSGTSSLTSIWIDANSPTSGTSVPTGALNNPVYSSSVQPLSGSNYFTTDSGDAFTIRGNGSGLISPSQATTPPYNINANVPNISGAADVYVYCRLGIPMATPNVSFSGVTLTLSSN